MRVLQVVNDMHRAGLETMLMNYYRNINREDIQFDFLTHRAYKSDYDDEIISLGGKMYYAPRLYPQNYLQYFKWMRTFFYDHPEYQIIHSHIDTMSYLPLLAAKKARIPVRIAHSHNTSIDKDFKYPLSEYPLFSIQSFHIFSQPQKSPRVKSLTLATVRKTQLKHDRLRFIFFKNDCR